MHVLFVTGILYRYCISVDGVGVVPFPGMCHVVAVPSAQCGLAAVEGLLYLVTVENRMTHIPFHVFIRIYMLIFQPDVSIEFDDLLNSPGRDAVIVMHLTLHITVPTRPLPHHTPLQETYFFGVSLSWLAA